MKCHKYCIAFHQGRLPLKVINVHWLQNIKIFEILTCDMYNEPIEPVQQRKKKKNSVFLIHQFKHVFWELKRTVLSTYVLSEKLKNNFQLHTLIWPAMNNLKTEGKK